MNEVLTKEQEILKAAEEVFLEKGFALAKTTEIAGKAGVTHAMLHYYYRTKEKIFEKIFERKIRELTASLAVHFPADMPFLELARLLVESHFDFVAANPRLPRFVLQEVISNPSRSVGVRKLVTPFVDQLLTDLTGRMDEAVRKGEIRPVEPLHLLYDVASLNIFAFLSLPAVVQVMKLSEKECQRFLAQRKAENVEVVLSRLRP